MAGWIPLLSGALEGDGEVPVRLEMSADKQVLRFSIQVDGHWYRQAQNVPGLFNRFLKHVQSNQCLPDSTSSPTASDSEPSAGNSAEASPSKASQTTATEPTSEKPSR